MIRRFPGNSSVFMELEEGGSVFKVAALALGADGLDFAELVQGFLELAGEPLGVHTEGGEGTVGVDDIEVDGGLLGGRVGGAVEKGGFEQRNTVEAPRGVGDLLGELSLGGSDGLVFVEKLAAVVLVGVRVLGCDYGGTAGEAVREGVEGRTLFAGGGSGSSGEEGVCPIYGAAVRAMAGVGGWLAAAGGYGCHGRISGAVLA